MSVRLSISLSGCSTLSCFKSGGTNPQQGIKSLSPVHGRGFGALPGYGSHVPRGCLVPRPSKTPLAALGWVWGRNLAFQYLLPEGKPQSNSFRVREVDFGHGLLAGCRDGGVLVMAQPNTQVAVVPMPPCWGWGGPGRVGGSGGETKLPPTQNVRTRMWCNVWGWEGSAPVCCSGWSCTRLSRSPAASPAPVLSLALVGMQSSWSSLHFHQG